MMWQILCDDQCDYCSRHMMTKVMATIWLRMTLMTTGDYLGWSMCQPVDDPQIFLMTFDNSIWWYLSSKSKVACVIATVIIFKFLWLLKMNHPVMWSFFEMNLPSMQRSLRGYIIFYIHPSSYNLFSIYVASLSSHMVSIIDKNLFLPLCLVFDPYMISISCIMSLCYCDSLQTYVFFKLNKGEVNVIFVTPSSVLMMQSFIIFYCTLHTVTWLIASGRTKFLMCFGTSEWEPLEMRSVHRGFFGNKKGNGNVHQIESKKEPVRKNMFTIFW